ncbi:MAG: YceI family protein [Candidatus Omnitrophica bacterium]|nr:YceI family protein [Candidatus Omnitrophota bacterium]MDE2223636.1 YceI family protein [Candidatus Omnitrophota bacterium]
MSRHLILIFLILMGACKAFADDTYMFNCKDSKVQGEIKYGVIGGYHFDFNDCSGRLSYDPLKKEIKSVQVQVKVDSIASNCPWCDRIVVSKRLLDAAQFPFIKYQANSSDQAESVNGIIDLHGVSKGLVSKFILNDKNPNRLYLKGEWAIKRKEFNIMWNPLLDHGGVLVGDTINVNWEVHANRMKTNG